MMMSKLFRMLAGTGAPGAHRYRNKPGSRRVHQQGKRSRPSLKTGRGFNAKYDYSNHEYRKLSKNQRKKFRQRLREWNGCAG